jgi:hypothetical protein
MQWDLSIYLSATDDNTIFLFSIFNPIDSFFITLSSLLIFVALIRFVIFCVATI